MARQTTDVLFGYGFAVGPPSEPVDGASSEVAFRCPETGHTVVVPLTDEGRRRLATALTGGVHLATRIPAQTG